MRDQIYESDGCLYLSQSSNNFVYFIAVHQLCPKSDVPNKNHALMDGVHNSQYNLKINNHSYVNSWEHYVSSKWNNNLMYLKLCAAMSNNFIEKENT
ncbi:hypothetical protein NQ314_012098 [Rhamnusium bicolor]|uniref:Uncharacterized protein n=1 Tax=Rhamnusium bicolor TaxID=1586634 RepID=A0AAV8XE57_9CUCU|nr:hypothetical protein NQ314_012098 [Rhamnusium bicolor]